MTPEQKIVRSAQAVAHARDACAQALVILSELGVELVPPSVVQQHISVIKSAQSFVNACDRLGSAIASIESGRTDA